MGLVIAGIMLLVAGLGVLPLLAARSARRARTFAEVPQYDCAQVAEHGAEAPGMRIAVRGRTIAGSGGPLTAPATGRPCAWYRLTISERHRRVERDKDGNRRTREEERVVSDERSPDPIALADSTGTVVIDPEGARMDRTVETHNRVERPSAGGGSSITFAGVTVDLSGGDSLIGIRTKEEILPLDDDVYVLGGAYAREGGGTIGRPRDGMFVVSTRSAEDLAKGSRTAMRALAAAAVVAAIAGVALLVAGIVA